MSVLFTIILHLLLLGSLLLFVVVFVGTAFATQDRTERFLRVAAVFAGAMVSLGATASGVNYATYTVSALAQGRTVTAAAHFFSAIIPALIGCGIGFFLVRTINKSTRLAMRTLGFVGMLATTAFIEVYAQAATLSGFKLGAAALPNIGFTAGVILTVVFTYDPDKVGSQGSGSKLSSFVSSLARPGRGADAGPAGARNVVPGARPAPGHPSSGHSASPQFTPRQFDDRQYRGL